MALSFKIFEDYPDLIYGLSEKEHGPMEFPGSLGPQTNRRLFLSNHSLNLSQTVSAGLAHSGNVAKVDSAQMGQVIPDTDGLLTNGHKTVLTVTVADCLPLYFYDPRNKAVGLAHSGWRGALKNIVGEMVEKFKQTFGTNTRGLLVAIGPGIRSCHFEIQRDILKEFEHYQKAVIYRNGRIFIDLPEICKTQLLLAGITNSNIEDCGICTYDSYHQYFSFRRDNPAHIQAMLAYCGLV